MFHVDGKRNVRSRKGFVHRGAEDKSGSIPAANGGTIFLDEIGELLLEMQAKLLRVLQEKEIRPVGSNSKISVDVRVIAATNRDLEASYKTGTFRKDLYFRLNVVTIHSPALRERRSDIPQLVHCFLDRYAPGENIQVTSAAMKSFLQYEWPGNVRELENCIARAVALGDHSTIDIADLPTSSAKRRKLPAKLATTQPFPPPPWQIWSGSRSCASSSRQAAIRPVPDGCWESAARRSTAN